MRTQAEPIPGGGAEYDYVVRGHLGEDPWAWTLELSGRPRASRFVSRWPTPLLLMGIYNKIVKTMGTR